MATITTISGTITLDDGRTHEFSLGVEGYSQWGATREQLGETVDALAAMQYALRGGDHLEDEDEGDDDPFELAPRTR